MFRWFARRRAEARFGGRTAREWDAAYRWRDARDTPLEAEVTRALQEAFSSDDKITDLHAGAMCLLMADDRDAARCAAAIQLGIDGASDAESALIAALNDGCEWVRRIAADSLLRIGSVRGLAAVISGSTYGHSVRTHAGHRLRVDKTGTAEVIPALMLYLRDTDYPVYQQMGVALVLAQIGDAAIPVLTHALRHGSPQLRVNAAFALKEMGKTPDLIPLINIELETKSESGVDQVEN